MMKYILDKVKKTYKDFITGKSGFSLVELIVVIAIMAVMAAVLAPSLLGYVEKSRMQKDQSAMSEIANALKLSLADQEVYDELLQYSCEQYSCYVDSNSPNADNKVDIKPGKYYMYNDNERQLDETAYRLDGLMRGVTITLAPNAGATNSALFQLSQGQLNKYMPTDAVTYGGFNKPYCTQVAIGEMNDAELYHALRSVIGDEIKLTSQTYRNSEYTIFISMGTTGGNQADMQDVIQVWGQWSGTNLEENQSVALGTKNESNGQGENVTLTTPPEAKEIPSSRQLDTVYTWAELSAIAKSGEARTTYGLKLGDTIAINDYRVRIIGFDHDGENTITFMTTTVLEPTTIEDTLGGYDNSSLKKYLNNDLYNSLPADLKNVIVPVTKKVDLGANAASRTEVIDSPNHYLFPLSLDEVWGPGYDVDYCHLGLGTQYELFATNKSFVALNTTTNVKYLLRTGTYSPGAPYDRLYYIMNANQCGNVYKSTDKYCVAYAFVL